MKIVDRKTFLAMPTGTVFAKYTPHMFGELNIKGDTCPSGDDFYVQWIADSFKTEDGVDYLAAVVDKIEAGQPLELDFDSESRDGLFDDGQLFAVWDRVDVEKLIKRLGECV